MDDRAEIRCAVELREGADDAPARLYGVLLTYGERAQDRPELFTSGSLSWPSAGVVLNREHDRKAPILRFTPEVRDGAVVVDVEIPDTRAGRDAAEEIRAGLFTGLSVEFAAREVGRRGGVREIRKALLLGAGLVGSPAYRAPVEVRERAFRRRVWL